MSHRNMWPISLSLFQGFADPYYGRQIIGHFYFDVCMHMKEVEQINDTALIAKVLGTMVCEKSDLVWVVPYDPEIQEQLVSELFSEFPVSEN